MLLVAHLIFRLDLIEASVEVRFVSFRALSSYARRSMGILSKELFFCLFLGFFLILQRGTVVVLKYLLKIPCGYMLD